MTGHWDCYAHVGSHRNVAAHDLLDAMDRCGIERAMLVPFMDAPGSDDLLDATRAHPQRFLAVCRFDPAHDDRGLQTLEAQLDQGFSGARVGLPAPGSQDKAMAAVLDVLDQRAKVLLVHAPDGIGLHARQISDWVERYRALRVFIPHLGWPRTAQGAPTPEWAEAVHSLAAHDRVYLGLSALYYFSTNPPPFEDAHEFVRSAVEALGPGRCVLAGDYPMSLARGTYAEVWESLAQAVGDPVALERMWTDTPRTLWRAE